MKKASATVIYNGKSNQLYNLTINHAGNMITLVTYENEKAKPYVYSSFQDLYKSVLQIAKNNGFYFGKYNQFNADFYDVAWIDCNNPYAVNKYGYKAN